MVKKQPVRQRESAEVSRPEHSTPEEEVGHLLVRQEFTGPVPPPSVIGDYEAIFPGAAKLIFSAWEKQADHRRALETRVIEADIASERRGVHLAFMLAALAVIGGTVLVALDKNAAGLVAILTALGTPAGLFIYSKHRQARELEEKTPTPSD